jgi:Tol biopolymer transport system component
MTVDRQSSIVTTASLDVFDREGQFLRTLDPSVATFSLSPDGSTVAIGKSGGVWLTALSRVAPVRLTGTGNIFHGGVAWSRDANTIYFTRNANARQAPFRRALRPDAVDELLFDATATTSVNSQRIQPLDNTLVVRAISRTAGASYDLMTLDAKGELHPWQKDRRQRNRPSASPDGRWVAFDSDAGGENVYVKPADGSTVPVRVSQAGGRNARWRGDGRELY